MSCEIESPPATLEVLVQLQAGRVHALRRAQDTRAGDPCELLEMRLGSRVEGDRSEALVGGGDEERADRGLDDVEAEVDELQRESRLAKATVEVG